MGYVSYQEGKHSIEGFDSPQFACRIRIEEAMLQVEVSDRLLIGSRIHPANAWICLRWLEQVPEDTVFQKMVIAWWVSETSIDNLTLSKSNIYIDYWFIPSFRPRCFSYSLHWYVDTTRHHLTSGCFMLHQRKPHPWDVDCSPMINIHDQNGIIGEQAKLRNPQKCDTLQRKIRLLPTSLVLGFSSYRLLYRSDLTISHIFI